MTAPLSRVVFNDFYAAATASSASLLSASTNTQIDAVLLLNSPDHATSDVGEWMRIRRQFDSALAVCADGAFNRLLSHPSFVSGGSIDNRLMPHIVCGDFDSIHLPKNENVTDIHTSAPTSPSGSPTSVSSMERSASGIDFHSVVKNIVRIPSCDDLESVDLPWVSGSQPTPQESATTQFINIQDQDNTDFDKCLKLIEVAVKLSAQRKGLQQGQDLNDGTAHHLTRVMVLGASGGRLDHELAALNAVARTAVEGKLEVVLSTPRHTTFAVPPNAVVRYRRNVDHEGTTVGLIPLCAAKKGISITTQGFKWNFGPDWTPSVAVGWGGLLSTSNEFIGKDDDDDDDDDGVAIIDTTAATHQGEEGPPVLVTVERRQQPGK